jgi:hypothetical protein
MNFLKALLATVLTLLLFLSLAVFGMLFTLRSTFLNPDFVAAQVDRLDAMALVEETIKMEGGGQTSPETALLEEAMYQTIADNEPWIKEQVKGAVYDGYDYLLGKSERLHIVISLELLKEDLEARVWQLFQQNMDKLPPELSQLPPGALEQYFNEFYRPFAAEIPSQLEFDENSIPLDIMANLLVARESISYAQTAFYALIALMVVLVAGIILLHRSVKGATRELGITFLIYGAIEYAGVWATQRFMPGVPLLGDVPASVQAWVNGLILDLIAPMQILAIGLMAAGAALIITSIVYPRLRPAAEEEE